MIFRIFLAPFLKKHNMFSSFSLAHAPARALCCVVSADVTAGSASSRGVGKSWDRSSGEKRATDPVKLLSAAHGEH